MTNGINGMNARALGGISDDMIIGAAARIGGAFLLCQDEPKLIPMARGLGIQTIYRQSGDDPTHNPLPDSNSSAVIKAAAESFTIERGKKGADYVHLTNELGSSPKLHEFTRYCLETCAREGWRGLPYNYGTHTRLQEFVDARANLVYAIATKQAVGVHMYPDVTHDATVAEF